MQSELAKYLWDIGYSTVDYDFVWGFIQLDLPRLKEEVQQLREP